ncbi:MAG TPA: hypothetical protein VFE14_10540, partial [Micromonosporaceae bacterium]|nr:hypothetical protein [Micromonosporaceae bacterium]
YALGPIAGIALLTKNLVTVFLVALLAGILVAGPRELLTRRPLWISAVVAALMWAPNVWWQATHGWPQLEMTAVIREDADWGGRLGLLPVQPLLMAVSLTPVWIAGLWRLLRNPQARPWRALAVAYLVVLGIVLLTGGREYYPAGAYPALIASGAIATIGWLDRAAATARTVRGGLIAAAIALAAIGAAVTGLPIYPASSFAGTPEAAVNYDAGETIGWPEFAATVAGVYGSLPESERPTVVILTGNYGQAGALERYGERLGLPAPYSGQLAYWRWGPPPDTATGPVIVVGSWTDEDLLRYCRTVTREATNDNGYGVDNEEQGLPIRVCRGMIRPWSQIWPELRHL